MFPFAPKGQKALFIIHDPRLHAWTFRVGYSSPSSGRRPHRGMLPDVDFSMAVPAAGRKPLLRRIIDLIRPRRRSPGPEPDPGDWLSGSRLDGVGKTAAALYDPPVPPVEKGDAMPGETDDAPARAA